VFISVSLLQPANTTSALDTLLVAFLNLPFIDPCITIKNLMGMTNKMQLCRTIYYSIVA